MEQENKDLVEEQTNEPDTSDTGSGAKSIEDQLAELLAENKRLRRANDKASSEAASYKKQLNAKLTESERQEQERTEANERLQTELTELRRERDIGNLVRNFTVLGYSEDMAKEAAEAQYDNDAERLFAVQKKYRSELENKIKEQFMRGTPPPQGGGSMGGTPLTEAQIKQMTPAEINKAWNEGRIQDFLKTQKG